MANDPDDLVIRILREIRETQTDHSRMLNEHSEALSRVNARFAKPINVMPGLEPGIQGPHARRLRPWITGSGPVMTGVDETPEG